LRQQSKGKNSQLFLLFFSACGHFFIKPFVGHEQPRRTFHFEGESVKLVQVVFGARAGTLDLPDIAAGDVEEEGKVVLRIALPLPVLLDEPDDREVKLRFSCFFHRPCKKMKAMAYLAYKIISKPPAPPVRNPAAMIEDLLYRIQSNTDAATAERVIATLPPEYGQPLELYYVHELSRLEIARRLQCSVSTVSQRLTRGMSLLKYQLNPGAFANAERILQCKDSD